MPLNINTAITIIGALERNVTVSSAGSSLGPSQTLYSVRLRKGTNGRVQLKLTLTNICLRCRPVSISTNSFSREDVKQTKYIAISR